MVGVSVSFRVRAMVTVRVTVRGTAAQAYSAHRAGPQIGTTIPDSKVFFPVQ